MSASERAGGGERPRNRAAHGAPELARFMRNGRQRQSCRAFGRSAMDKFESLIFSVALIGAGLITLVTLPFA